MYIFIQCWKKSSSVCTTVLRYYLCYHLPTYLPTYGVVFSFAMLPGHKHLQPHYFRPLLESNEGI